MRFRRKHHEIIEGIQWTGTNRVEVAAFIGNGGIDDLALYPGETVLFREKGQLNELHKGEWLIRDDQHRLTICNTAFLQSFYDPIDDAPQLAQK